MAGQETLVNTEPDVVGQYDNVSVLIPYVRVFQYLTPVALYWFFGH